MNINTLRSQRPYLLRVSDKANLNFSLPPTLVVSPRESLAPIEAAIRLGLYVTQSRWFSALPLEGDALLTVLRAPELLVLGPELAVRVWPGECEAALIFRDDFSRDRLNANVIRHVSLPAKGSIVAALAWSECTIRAIIMGWRNDANLAI